MLSLGFENCVCVVNAIRNVLLWIPMKKRSQLLELSALSYNRWIVCYNTIAVLYHVAITLTVYL